VTGFDCRYVVLIRSRSASIAGRSMSVMQPPQIRKNRFR
jgi:hypothetical protein